VRQLLISKTFTKISVFWQLFVKELIILTLRGVDFTKIHVTESCVSQSLDCILIIMSQRLRDNSFYNQVSGQQPD